MWPALHAVFGEPSEDEADEDSDEIDDAEQQGLLLEGLTGSLQRRPRAVACCMHAMAAQIADTNITLQRDQCVVLGRGPAAITSKNVTFEGGALLVPFYSWVPALCACCTDIATGALTRYTGKCIQNIAARTCHWTWFQSVDDIIPPQQHWGENKPTNTG